jgi:hypothetical protein
VLQPLHGLAVESFLNGDVCHRRGRHGSVPMLVAGRKPDEILRADLFDWTALALHPADPSPPCVST